MAEEDLKKAVKDVLEKGSAFQKMKAEMRSHVYNALVKPEGVVKKQEPKSAFLQLANDIVREYLVWCECHFTKDMFEQESGISSVQLSRSEILQRLHASDTAGSVKLPVLLGVISSFKDDLEKT